MATETLVQVVHSKKDSRFELSRRRAVVK